MRFAQRLRSFLPFLCMLCSLCFTWCLLYALSVLGFRTPWLFFLCEHVLVVPCSYLSICGVFVCRIEKMNGKRFPDTFETPPLSSYMYDTYMVYLEISLFLSTYPCVSFSLYLFSPRFLHPSTNLSLTFYLWIYLFYLSINLSYPGPNIYNDIIIMYVNRFSHQKGRHFEVPQHTI